MTDLQLGLLVVGAIAVAAVLLYNRVQERSARRRAERAFASWHSDALLDEPSSRREPTFQPVAPSDEDVFEDEPTPDPRFDYVVELAASELMVAAPVLETWRTLERRFAGRALMACRTADGWEPLREPEGGGWTALRASLQLAGRDGPVSEGALAEFRSQLEDLAERLGARVSAPEVAAAAEAARALDQVCAEADIQVAFHVVAPEGRAFPEARVKAHAQHGEEPYALSLRRGQGIEAITLTLDVPRVPDVLAAYEAMARAGRDLATELDGRLVDDNGNALDERALGMIAQQLDGIRRQLAERGIEPGSALALRLFS
jgi:hypothetical protein